MSAKETKYLMYLRKSTDSEDRQVQSLEDQKKELDRIASQLKLQIIGIYQESQSAKSPGRPEFNKLIRDIKRGKANGIVCWKINRLARNPIDGGEIQWLLQQGSLQVIQTPGRSYRTGDNTLMMSVELGMATQYSIDLGKDVSRGMISKAEKGWRPGLAPLGYLNDKGGEQGKKIIHVDKEKFPLVRKMWELMMSGEYSIPKIVDIANNKWGLRMKMRKGEGKLHENQAYRIFTNPFYYGDFEFAGKLYPGKHEPMITRTEFDYVQRLLGIKSKPQTRHKLLPYRGTIRCGECDCSITTEIKTKRIKSTNEIKSYLYHHCTKRKMDTHCKQKSISFDEINRQVMAALDRITMPESFLHFALKILNRDNELEVKDRNLMIENQQKELKKCQSRIDNLLKIFISPDNADKELISDEEFKGQKTSLLKEKAEIEQYLVNLSERADEWLELTEKTFEFAVYAKHHFATGGYEEKTRILRALGSSFILKNGIVNITFRKQYQLIETGLEKIRSQNPGLELSEIALNKTKTDQYRSVSDVLSG